MRHVRKVPARGFVSTKPAEDWQEALISGNGKIGALVMSQPIDETIIFSHERLFMPWYQVLPLVDLSGHIGEIRKLIEAGRYADAGRLAQDLSHNYGYSVKSVGEDMQWPDPFVPAFDLRVKMRSKGEVRGYARSLDWATGVATVRYTDDDGGFSRRLFVSRADNLAVLSITGQNGEKVSCELTLAARPSEVHDGDDAPLTDGIKEAVTTVDAPWLSYQSSFNRIYHGSIQGYEGLAKVVTDGRITQTGDKTIQVDDAKEVLVLVLLDVLYDLQQTKLAAQKARLDQLAVDFDYLLGRHEKIHGEIFNRMRLDLGGSEEDRELSSEELFEKTELGNLNKALLEKQFDACRYGILSSTGDWPPALQGVWTGTWRPRWKGDYTIDGNIQSAIASMLMANMPECLEAYINYTELFLPHFRENARQIYGYRGILMPSRTSAHGYLNHFSYDFMWMYWIASAPWAAHHFYDYYLYTGDREFLRDRAVPFMKDVALFYEDFLYEGPDGTYVFNPSYSPENTPSNSDNQVCINATMDIGFAKELLTNLVAACEQLGIEEHGVKRWKNMLTKMPDYMTNRDGAVKEWTTNKLEENYVHRHAAHLCHLADWLPEDIASDPQLKAGFRRAVELKMASRRKARNRVGVMAFGIVELGQAATSLKDCDLSYEAVDMIANRFWRATNMTPTHDPGGVFNMDAAGGLPAVIIKMLVMSEVGGIDLLPALPKEWPTGTIEGVLCRGQIEIKKLSWDDEQIDVRFVSQLPQSVKISVPGSFKEARIGRGNSDIVETFAREGTCRVAVPPGELVEVHFVR